MKKLQTLFFTILVSTSAVFAQPGGGAIEFKESSHDFGSVKEEGGPVAYEFIFTNTGKEPVTISNVKASCGCTTPAWTKEPVMPGKTGFIKAEYNPMNRPGVFNKTLTITSNTEPATTILTIKGNVVPKPKTPADEYPKKIGAIRLNSDYLNFGSINTKEPVTKEFIVYNDSESPVTFTNQTSGPKHIKVSIEPMVVKPKEKGVIKVTYDAKGKNDYGYVNDQIELKTTEAADNKKALYIVATISEYFPPMSAEEMEKAPKLTFTTSDHDFGNVKHGEIVTTEFEFTNTGKQPLHIRKAKASCGCTTGLPERNVVKPGEKSKIKVTFNSTGRDGNESKTVTVYSDDPAMPIQTLTIKANVVKE